MFFKKIVFCFLVLAVGCSGANANISKNDKTKKNIDWSKAVTRTIYGKIINGPNDKVAIATTWRSRSRIVHVVFGDLQKKLTENIGKFASVNGKVLSNKRNRWKQKILVEKIIQINDNPQKKNKLYNKKRLTK